MNNNGIDTNPGYKTNKERTSKIKINSKRKLWRNTQEADWNMQITTKIIEDNEGNSETRYFGKTDDGDKL